MPALTEPEEARLARHRLALLLVRLGKRVITFDPIGESGGEIAPLLRHARHCLDLSPDRRLPSMWCRTGRPTSWPWPLPRPTQTECGDWSWWAARRPGLSATMRQRYFMSMEDDPVIVAQAQALAALLPDCRLESGHPGRSAARLTRTRSISAPSCAPSSRRSATLSLQPISVEL